MTRKLSIAVAQINPLVGDIQGNAEKIRAARDRAAKQGVDLVVFSELVLVGYPPEDLVLKPALQTAAEASIDGLRQLTSDSGPALLIGATHRVEGALYNAAYLLDGGKVSAVRHKHFLPNYGVFDERRLFSAGRMPTPVEFRGVRLGVMICEDMWTPEATESLRNAGARLLVIVNASPFDTEKPDVRHELAKARVGESGVPLIYSNQVGGQDELVFDGASFALDSTGALGAQSPSWHEHLLLAELRQDRDGKWDLAEGEVYDREAGDAAIYLALVTGLRDYVEKNRFPSVVVGMSGGIDSALSAALAVDALGPERVHCIRLPSRYTSRASMQDAADCAARLGARSSTIPIEPAVEAFSDMLSNLFQGCEPDVTEENLQARARGLALMAVSNKFGDMVVTTGNKSELSVGYATLYGDMCGGFAVLKDVYKTTVYALSRWRNENQPAGGKGPPGEVIPACILTKAPTAELRPNQTDQDSLPPYEELDDILHYLIEREFSIGQIAALGHNKATVSRISRLLDIAEYKRRQAPPGVKISSRAFGRDRRYPITNRFRDTD